MPLQLWSSGFNSQVIQEEIANAMLDVEREGRAREATRELALEVGDDSIDLVTDYFELTPLVRAFQQSGGFVSYVVDAHVTSVGDDYVLELDIAGRDGSELTATVSHPSSDIPGFIRKGAEAIMRVVEPEPLCASYLAQALSAIGRSDACGSCVEETLPIGRDQRPQMAAQPRGRHPVRARRSGRGDGPLQAGAATRSDVLAVARQRRSAAERRAASQRRR